MKAVKLMTICAAITTASFTSCKKDYTCTCTTVIANVSVSDVHGISNANYVDAKKECYNYEVQANKSFPGGTTCHL